MRTFCVGIALLGAIASLSLDRIPQPPLPVNRLGSLGEGERDKAASHLRFLDNGTIRLGVNLDLGGAITYLSRSGTNDNVVNSFDWGRQIQMSYYAGPVPFAPGGNQPAAAWKGLGWNPIQVGDCFGNRARVIECRQDGDRGLYVKCVPMQWPLDNVPGDCTFESWLRLDGATVSARCRIKVARADRTQYPGRDQECPAVYVNGPYWHLRTYSGDRPFIGDTLTEVHHPFYPPDASFPTTERWAAMVNDAGFGLGVYSPETTRFLNFFAGTPGSGGPHDAATNYVAPTTGEILDATIQHDYRYTLILGNLPEIRDWVYRHADRPRPPDYEFRHDRQHWRYLDAVDTGWPIRGELNLHLTGPDPQMISSDTFFPAKDAPTLTLRAAFTTHQTTAKVFWRCLGDSRFSEARSLEFPIVGDGCYRTYDVPLATKPTYTGAIVALRLDPVPTGGPDDTVRIRSIRLH